MKMYTLGCTHCVLCVYTGVWAPVMFPLLSHPRADSSRTLGLGLESWVPVVPNLCSLAALLSTLLRSHMVLS